MFGNITPFGVVAFDPARFVDAGAVPTFVSVTRIAGLGMCGGWGLVFGRESGSHQYVSDMQRVISYLVNDLNMENIISLTKNSIPLVMILVSTISFY